MDEPPVLAGGFCSVWVCAFTPAAASKAAALTSVIVKLFIKASIQKDQLWNLRAVFNQNSSVSVLFLTLGGLALLFS
jgi:hypothetical protein